MRDFLTHACALLASVLLVFLTFSCRQIRMPEDFIEKFQNLATKLRQCAEEAKEEEENTPEVCHAIVLEVANFY